MASSAEFVGESPSFGVSRERFRHGETGRIRRLSGLAGRRDSERRFGAGSPAHPREGKEAPGRGLGKPAEPVSPDFDPRILRKSPPDLDPQILRKSRNMRRPSPGPRAHLRGDSPKHGSTGLPCQGKYQGQTSPIDPVLQAAAVAVIHERWPAVWPRTSAREPENVGAGRA